MAEMMADMMVKMMEILSAASSVDHLADMILMASKSVPARADLNMMVKTSDCLSAAPCRYKQFRKNPVYLLPWARGTRQRKGALNNVVSW